MPCQSEWKIRKRFLENKSYLKQVHESENCEHLIQTGTRDQLRIIFQVLHCILHGKIPMKASIKQLISSNYSGSAKKIYDSHFSKILQKSNYLDLLQPLAKIIPNSFYYLFNKK